MAKKDQPQLDSNNDPELEKRVDVIMDDDLPRTDASVNVGKSQVIDVFSDPLSAPAVPKDLLKKIGVVEKSDKTVHSRASKASEDQNEPAEPTVIMVNPAEARPAIDKLHPTIFPKEFEPTIQATPESGTRLDDPVSDAAIAAITASDSDELLAAEDAKSAAKVPSKIKKPSLIKRILRRKLLLFLLLAALVAAFAVPTSRDQILGAVIKRDMAITVLDASTSKPVSAAKVSVKGASAITNADGKATIKVPYGEQQLVIAKQYYKDSRSTVRVGFGKVAPASPKITATGRQVPLTFVNRITGAPLANVDITILDTSAKSDKDGKATIVLPTVGISTGGTAKSNGFNDATLNVQITSEIIAANTFSLTPSGKVYMLSNENGTVDVVSKNLDGTGKEVVLAGTGREDVNSTTLLVSRDWRYAVLRAQRDTPQPALYLIDTSNNKVMMFDSGDTAFTTIGWIGHSFIYDAVKNTVPASQTGREAIRSYDAERGQLNQIDQGQAEGDATSYAYQGFYNFFIVGDQVIYNTQWYSSGGRDISDKPVVIRGAGANGQGKKDFQTIPGGDVGYIQAAQVGVRSLNYAVYSFNSGKTAFYQFDGQTASPSTAVTQASFNKVYPRYMISPSGKSALWSETRDGNDIVLTGSSTGTSSSAKQLNGFNEFTVYGWYSDDYVLLSKDASELYIAPADASKAPIKLSDYFQAGQATGNGYGNL